MTLRQITLTFIVLLATASMALAGGAVRGYLVRPEASPDDDARGFVKIKADKKSGDLHLLEVKGKNLAPGTYDVQIGGESVGDLVVAEGENSGKWKVNTRRGDEAPVDPAGKSVEVYAGADLVLRGTVPDPTAKPAKGGNRKGDLTGEDDADGFVMVKAGKGAELLKVLVRKVDPGDYEVFMHDGGDPGEMVKVGDITVPAGESSGDWMMNNRRGDPYPFDVDTLADIAGRAIEVRTAGGALVGTATVPDPAAPKGKGKGKGQE